MTPKHVELFEAISILGTNIAGDKSIQPLTKHKGCKLTMTPEGMVVEYRDSFSLIPSANLKLVLFGPKEDLSARFTKLAG